MKSLFRYYGGKFNQLKDIIAIMQEHIEAFDIVVDVFGGSGKVLLNIPNEWRKSKVYNDLDDDLYVTFKVLQDPVKRNALMKKLRLAFSHEKIFMEMRDSRYQRDVETAFRLIYLQTYSFMGDGRSFGRRYKGNRRMSRFTIENFVYVKDWTIENMDFKDIMKKYAKPRVLFYLDPPYLSSGKKYKHSFTIEDLKDLKRSMDNHPGSYLLNLSSFDEGMEEIFGKPQKIIEYANPLDHNGTRKWGCGYWWEFKKN
ncbi:MAG: DNA adenine methylase [Thermoplasmataceae archaeon]